tara:strand:- start:1189 stop:1440 length:252 start_codon:yes stop_codon:yes gene_type:complete
MIIFSVVIKAYAAMTILTFFDEQWNINNPRPFPKANYVMLQWEEKDFYTFKVKGKWILRKYRKTDSKLKRRVRNKYWEKMNEI